MDLRAPNAFSSAWRCGTHGDVLPLRSFHRLDSADLDHVRREADVPVWFPDPLPLGWMLSGIGAVGDARSRFRATAMAFRGPAPLGGEGEWLFVAEEPEIGLGGSYAGATELPSALPPPGPAPAKIHAHGHPTSLWPLPSYDDERSVYVGEAGGVWLWLVSFPADAGYAVLEDLTLSDARTGSTPILPVGDPSERLRPKTPE
jgi:hypothetical protein